MSNSIILPGGGESFSSCWLSWLKENLEKNGYSVWLADLPHNDNPTLEDNLPFVLKNGTINEESVMVGHSAGVPLILSVLENIEVKIKQAVMVAGLVEPSTNDPAITAWQKPFLQDSYNWEKIKANCRGFYFINAVNDPWGCNEKQGRKMFDALGGTLIINNEGHMGSDTFKQPYKEFPLLLKLIL